MYVELYQCVAAKAKTPKQLKTGLPQNTARAFQIVTTAHRDTPIRYVE